MISIPLFISYSYHNVYAKVNLKLWLQRRMKILWRESSSAFGTEFFLILQRKLRKSPFLVKIWITLHSQFRILKMILWLIWSPLHLTFSASGLLWSRKIWTFLFFQKLKEFAFGLFVHLNIRCSKAIYSRSKGRSLMKFWGQLKGRKCGCTSISGQPSLANYQPSGRTT